jgi:hypothetical protein
MLKNTDPIEEKAVLAKMILALSVEAEVIGK